MEKLNKYKPYILMVLSAIFALVLSTLTTYFALKATNAFKGEDPVDKNKEKVFVKEENEFSKSFSVVLLGYGGAGHPGGTLSDVIMVARIDPEKKKVYLISVPRDIWIDLPLRSDSKEFYKINFAHAIGMDDERYPLKEPLYKGEHGGGEMAKYAVGEVIGLPVKYYLGVDFGNFEAAIDELGGIEVEVPVTFDDYFYPVKGLENEPCGKSPEEIAQLTIELSGFELEKLFECRYEHLHFNAGNNEMDGVSVLKFVRSRHSEQHGGDFARSQRQQTVLEGIRDKVLSLEALDDIPGFFKQFSGMIKTDLAVDMIVEVSKALGNPYEYEVANIGLSDENVLVSSRSNDGQFILIPKEGVGLWSGVHEYVRAQLDNHDTEN